MRRIILLVSILMLFIFVFAGQVDILKKECSRWSSQIDNFFPPPRLQFDRTIFPRVDENRDADGIGMVFEKFGIYGEKVLSSFEPMDEDFVLGYYNPDTVLVIDSDTSIYVNIILVNNAQLIIRDCTFNLAGNIYATGNSQIIIEDANFNLLQEFIYQFSFVVIDSARFEMNCMNFNTARFPASVASIGISNFVMDSVNMNDAFITFAVMEQCSISIRYSDGAGEFVMLGDDCKLDIAHSDTILLWLGFPKNSSGEVNGSYSMDEFVEHFAFPDSTCTGIGYSVRFDSLSSLMLATMAEDSTDVVVRNADLRSCGNIFSKEYEDTISGLVNGSHYDDFSPSLPGRSLTLYNSSVAAWNFYDFGENQITYKSCIFGECLVDSISNTTIMNATCDGAGGHIGAAGNSFLLMFYSTLFTDALLEGHSTSMFLLTSFLTGNIIVKNSAVALLYNTSLVNPILVYDSAAVFETALYPPSPAYVNDSVSIIGTAAISRADDSPFAFQGYRIEYAPSTDTSVFFPIADFTTEQVRNDELCRFSTFGLDVGQYLMRLWYFFSAYGASDSVSFDNYIYLTYNVGIAEQKLPYEFDVYISPNPFNSSCKITAPAGAEVEIYDVMGNVVVGATRWVAQQQGDAAHRPYIWQPDKSIPSGIYLIRAKTNDGRIVTKRALLIK